MTRKTSLQSSGGAFKVPATFGFLAPSYDGPVSWLWFVGAARLGLLLVVATGAHLVAAEERYLFLLTGVYLAACASGIWYLVSLRGRPGVNPALTWMQMMVDFGVVAITISFSGAEKSFFTFLLVTVILEAGVLMGLSQGFVFATLSSLFMFFHFAVSTPRSDDPLTHWYHFLILVIGFFFTAFISGYWNQRVSGMKQFQREILDNLSSGFLICDTKGLVIAMNRAACHILGVDEGNVAGRHVEGIIMPESGAENPVVTALRSQKDFTSYEFHARVGEQETKLLGLTTNPLRDSRGAVTGLIASFTDLTEMAHMRQLLQQQDRMAVIGELTAGLAHEIRNPVAAIRGAMEELRRGTEKPAMVERLANIAIRESDHLNDIVTGFLDFARDPSRRHTIVNLSAMVDNVRAHLERQFAHARDLRITTRTPETVVEVLGDRMQLRQVFLNLGQNAIEAMHEQGTLTISLLTDAGPAEVRFDDEGPGIPPDKVSRIFEPFFTEKERGVGMGLAICLRIVTSHDGTMQVAARPEGGTSMRVRLPRVVGGGDDTETPDT